MIFYYKVKKKLFTVSFTLKDNKKMNGKMNAINCDANLAKENPVNTACKCNIGFYLSNNPS